MAKVDARTVAARAAFWVCVVTLVVGSLALLRYGYPW